ncbi:MAG: hypothetical protein NTV54_11680 [Ignavibacteriales bacterium]|nr:hypothetical protein [Ignavibacteriales bacterium]
MTHTTIRLGIPDDEYLRSLFEAMKEFCRQKTETSPEYSGLSFNTGGNDVERLLNDELDAAIIPVLEFAKNSSDLSLYPGFAVSSTGESGLVKLLTRSDVKSITRLALGPVSPQDAVLAKIILSEQFEQDIEFVSTAGEIAALVQKADGVVVSSDEALHLSVEIPTLDLTAEWTEMTDLPFVHFVCVGKKWTERSLLSGMIAEMDAGDDLLPDGVRLGLSESELNGIAEFFRYAFYLGILPDIPEIELFEEDARGR